MANRIAFALLAATLITAGVTDWRSGRVYNWLTYPAMLAGLLYWVGWGLASAATAGAVEGLTRSTVALAAGLIPFAVIFALGGLGGGDVKLMGVVGALSARPRCVVATACYAFVIAAVMAVVVMLRKRLVIQTVRRIFLAALARARRVESAPLNDSPRIPFSVAVAVGGVVAAMQYLLGIVPPWSALGP